MTEVFSFYFAKNVIGFQLKKICEIALTFEKLGVERLMFTLTFMSDLQIFLVKN